MTRLDLGGLSLALVMALGMAATAEAESAAAPFPQGKPVSMYIGGTPGGTNDALSRLVARHLGKYLPGNPTVIPKSMAGAAGRRAAGYLYSVAGRDGTEIGSFNRNVAIDAMLIKGAQTLRPQELLWLGTPSGAIDICAVWHTAPVKSVADILNNELFVGVAGPELAQVLLLQRLTGGKIKPILGYLSQTANLAMERGEVQARCGLAWESIKSSYPTWITEKKVNLIVQFALTKHPDLPNVPLITEFAKTAVDQQVMKILLTPNLLGYPFAAPPGLPPEVKQMLLTAFDNVWKDPVLLGEAGRMGFSIDPISGQTLQKAVEEAYSLPPEIVKRAAELTTP